MFQILALALFSTITSECTPGTKLAATLIFQPSLETLIFVKSEFLIKWNYTFLATQHPTTIDIKYSQEIPLLPMKFDTYIAKNLNTTQGETSYLWTPKNMADGTYRIRIVPDGKENLVLNAADAVRVRETVCFGDGDILPGNSAVFHVANQRSLGLFRDRFGPKVAGGLRNGGGFWLVLLVVFLLY